MLRYRLATLDELEAVEEQEKKEAEEKAGAVQGALSKDPFATTTLDLASVDDLFKAVSPSFQAELGGSSGTPIESRG